MMFDNIQKEEALEKEQFDNWCLRKRLYTTFYTDIVKRQSSMFYKPWANQKVSFRVRYKAFMKYYAKYVEAKERVSRDLNDVLFVKHLSGDALEYAIDDIKFGFLNDCRFDDKDCAKAILEENNRLYQL